MYCRFDAPTYSSAAEHKIKRVDYIYFPVVFHFDQQIREPINQVTRRLLMFVFKNNTTNRRIRAWQQGDLKSKA